jgi:acetolactate synthase I/II/III large subunit
MKLTGADYIVQFLEQKKLEKVFLVTGGACAFIVDSIARSEKLKYFCFHHEQSAAMAADAVWRVSGKVGVTLSTSGPGATNLITGIACSFFDSIPAIHITGQINLKDSSLHNGAKPRQKGFQETNIVDMVKPITKYSVLVTDINSLPDELEKAYNIATTGRMGPVLVDVPMNVQKETFKLVNSPSCRCSGTGLAA